jgi:hypothetical protein
MGQFGISSPALARLPLSADCPIDRRFELTALVELHDMLLK